MLKQITLEEAEFLASMGCDIMYFCASWDEKRNKPTSWGDVSDSLTMRGFATNEYRTDTAYLPVTWYVEAE